MSALARFASLLLGALNCGLSFAHLVEMVPKRAMNGRDWLTTQQAYRDFGRVARITMPGQLLATLATLALDRDDRANALLTGIDAACTTATVVIWAQFNEPVTARLCAGTPQRCRMTGRRGGTSGSSPTPRALCCISSG